MSPLIAVVILVPTILSSATSVLFFILEYKRIKLRAVDVVWETTTKLLCQKDSYCSDDFAHLYNELLFFKSCPDALAGFNSIEDAMKAKAQTQKQSVVKG